MDSEQQLERVIDPLAARHPHLDRQTVADTVYATHARLLENATVTDHLAALTQRQAAATLANPQPAPDTREA